MREGRIEKAAEEHVEAGRAMQTTPFQFQSELRQPEVVEDLGEPEEIRRAQERRLNQHPKHK